MIDKPASVKTRVDIPELLKDLGFVRSFTGSKGYVRLNHPDLILEFLVPERGRGLDSPYPIPLWSLNATPLRFLNFLTDNTIRVKVKDFTVTVPHPANFALHKLIIFQRRVKKEKAIKDRDMAVAILKALIDKGESKNIVKAYASAPQKWQKKILNGLRDADEREVLKVVGVRKLKEYEQA